MVAGESEAPGGEPSAIAPDEVEAPRRDGGQDQGPRLGHQPAQIRRLLSAAAPAQARCSRIRSTASARRSSGVVSEIRKKPSPLGPYIEPGETTTAASSSTCSAKEVEVWPSGTGAQT